jgi:hypothetical protein
VSVSPTTVQQALLTVEEYFYSDWFERKNISGFNFISTCFPWLIALPCGTTDAIFC